MPAFSQVLGRNVHVFLLSTTATYRAAWLIPLMIIWVVADSSRYAFYAAKLAFGDQNVVVSVLGAVRYNIFVLLYPAGLAVECLLHYYRMMMGATDGVSLMSVYVDPGADLVATAMPLWTLVVFYGFAVVFPHMFKQRRHFYRESTAASTQKKTK
jgi:hypothetical protein